MLIKLKPSFAKFKLNISRQLGCLRLQVVHLDEATAAHIRQLLELFPHFSGVTSLLNTVQQVLLNQPCAAVQLFLIRMPVNKFFHSLGPFLFFDRCPHPLDLAFSQAHTEQALQFWDCFALAQESFPKYTGQKEIAHGKYLSQVIS